MPPGKLGVVSAGVDSQQSAPVTCRKSAAQANLHDQSYPPAQASQDSSADILTDFGIFPKRPFRSRLSISSRRFDGRQVNANADDERMIAAWIEPVRLRMERIILQLP
jgi:hypothetical protein